MTEKKGKRMTSIPEKRRGVDRRTVLASTSMGLAAAAFLPRSAGAALTADEQAHVKTAHDYAKALEASDWDRFSSLLAEDARFMSHSASGDWARAEIKGRAAIVDRMKDVMSGLKDPEFKITREEALGHLVLHYREETFTTAQGPAGGNISAMFLVSEGKVQVWFELVGELPA